MVCSFDSCLLFFSTYSLQLLYLKLKELRVYVIFIHVFLPLVSYFHLSEKCIMLFVRLFSYIFAETEDALAKLNFLVANKCLSCLCYC